MKNNSFLLISKSQKVFKTFEAIGPGSFKGLRGRDFFRLYQIPMSLFESAVRMHAQDLGEVKSLIVTRTISNKFRRNPR